MLPSLLAREIRTGLRHFLVTGFEPSDTRFAGLVSRFAEDESRWLKGPFVQIGLPFRQGAKGQDFFADFKTKYPGFVHQENAWNRLSALGAPKSTLIATGTGSGKTEGFLYPVLDHCAREATQGKRGIKALIIYPMNALASDQARRIAATIAETAAFKHLRVGLYVGGKSGRGQMTMTAQEVITDRDTLRGEPPDILLTNYKMLDYLLIRPKDRRLWEKNAADTLKYVVVDELHTFDGAQGTDLAILLRRLKARLKSPVGSVVHVGTSATLGGGTDTAPLREYARQVFGTGFGEDAVVTENRLTEAEFLGNQPIEHVLYPSPGFVESLEPEKYAGADKALEAWFASFFPGQPAPADINNPEWRAGLGELLKRHLLFVNLLKIMKGKVVSLEDLQVQMQGPLPEALRPYTAKVLDALLALIGWARGGVKGQPFVNLRVQLWLRELRRMVASVESKPEEIRLRASSDIPIDGLKIHLPLVQCPECHSTAWLSKTTQGRSVVSAELDNIYNSWFGSHPEILRLYHPAALKRPRCNGYEQQLCVRCGSLQDGNVQCSGCGNKEFAPVFRVTASYVKSFQNGNQVLKHDKTCPACGSDNDPILLGVRNATMGAVAVEQSWASPYNDDKKLIAFSDSVQDAAHRAGFFSARTYLNTVRIGLTKVIDSFPQDQVAWPEFLERATKVWFDPASGLSMDPERFVSEFIGPNMTWQRDWAEELLGKGRLPGSSRLPERVAKRLRWQAFAEFTYIGRRGRNLETLGKAVLAPDASVIETAAAQLLPILKEQYGLRHLDEKRIFQWVWGIVTQMKLRGGVMNPEMDTYMRDGRFNGFYFAPSRKEWLPAMGRRTSHPRFLADGDLADHDRVGPVGNVRSFYEGWTVQLLSEQGLLPDGAEIELCREALKALVAAGLVVKVQDAAVAAYGLNPDMLTLTKNPARIISNQGRRTMVVPATVADRLLGMPCMQAMSETYVARSDDAHWLAAQFGRADLRRVYSAEHTGLLDREQREELEIRFKQRDPKPWYENLLSATPTLEMGVDIGDLSSVMLCSVPPNQASYLQRVGRAGRVDGNAFASTLADGASPHDLYFFEDTMEMLAGEVASPGIFLRAPEVLRRQMFAFCLDDWVGTGIDDSALPDKTKEALDARDAADQAKFPFTFLTHVQSREGVLLEGFKVLLSPDLDARVEERLLAFMMGTEEEDSLKIRLTKLLDELSKERKSHKERAESIAKKLKELAKKPQDEATENEQDNLERERQKALELAKEINQRDLLNAMTDAGLIPNYAFPEAGIELKSLLWRKRGADDPSGARNVVSLPAQRYERPANSALSEFAPENVFYANQRKVEIDQINLQLSSVESWRLCPTCQHMNNETVMPDTSGVCPSCGDPMWSNVSQVRDLLRFRQAIATSDDTKVRIDDSDDDREPKFYVRQLMTDFKPDDVELAYKVASTETPFGFEFVQKVVFRDVNFGEAGRGTEAYSVAGIERARPGFGLCRHCGKVQPEFEQDPQHSFDCPHKSAPAEETMIRCLYLYREFSSEALRILVPYTRSGVDETSVESFMAALRVGLKQRFGGKVDHLRLMTQEEKPRDGGASRHYVVLYDSVPGGTGYLRELLADKAKTLIDVIRLSLEKLKTCACNADPEKDGCYRCVYQHRLGKAMNRISRNRARDILESLSVCLDTLIEVKSVTDIYVNPNFDSELEARFIEGLRRLGGKEGLPRVELVQEIVRGKSGYLIIVGDHKYWIEPQAELGPSDGVKQPCKPDFLIRPVASGGKRRPIAVFCDGWTFHKDIARIDAQKRNAIVASGAFWIYSVTWEDVKAAMDEKADNELSSGLPAEAYVPAIRQQPAISALEYKSWDGRNAMASLIRWLGAATGEGIDPQVIRQAKHAYYLSAGVIPHPQDPAQEDRRAEHRSFWGKVTDLPCPIPAANSTPAGNVDASGLKLRYHWPRTLQDTNGALHASPGFLILDRSALTEEKEYHLAWRRWLRLFNLFQTLPGVYLATHDGLEAGDYQSIRSLVRPGVVSPNLGQPVNSAWDEVFALALADLHEDIRKLRDLGVPAPEEVGFELAVGGQVLAEAELAWPAKKVALLITLEDTGATFQKHGWSVVEAADGWPATIAKHLK